MNQRLLITLGILFFLIIGTFIAIKWAEGYRYNLSQRMVEGTGLLVANSMPQGASVYIDDLLTTATDDTLHLQPNDYLIRLEKDGYSSWQKKLKIDKELVTQTNARLFPAVPSLSALTVNSATDPHPSPDGQKIAYKIASVSANLKQGIWVTSLSNNPLRFGSSSIQIAKDTAQLKFSQADLFWAPNSNQVLAYFNPNQAYLLEINQENKSADLLNIALQLPNIVNDWLQQLQLEQQKKLTKMPEAIQKLATSSATLLYFSPNEEKLLYVATSSAILPENLVPPLPATSSQPQQRNINAGNLYIYDSKEDKNFLIINQAFNETNLKKLIRDYSLPNLFYADFDLADHLLPSPTPKQTAKTLAATDKTDTLADFAKLPILSQLMILQAQYSPVYSHNLIQWFPNSQHLIIQEENHINIMEYDGTNRVMIYAGPFEQRFIYPWPSGEKLVILTSLSTNSNVSANLYAIGLN